MLGTSFHNEAPEEIPRSMCSLGMTLAQGWVTPSSYAARSLHDHYLTKLRRRSLARLARWG